MPRAPFNRIEQRIEQRTAQRQSWIWCLVAGAVSIGLQVAYPLVDGDPLRLLTIWSVVAFALFSALHAFSLYSMRGVLSLTGACVGIGLFAEAVGFRTGFPFGNYRYASTLGLKLLGVPLVVPLAWAMMGWVALVASRRVFGDTCRASAYGALILTAWDLLLDPQMVDAGHWVWAPTPGPSLNGIPMVNSLGWFVVAFVMLAVLGRLLPLQNPSSTSESSVVPSVGFSAASTSTTPFGSYWPAWAMLAWTWFSETFGHLVFFGRPAVALIGGTIFGIVLLPWAIRVRADAVSAMGSPTIVAGANS